MITRTFRAIAVATPMFAIAVVGAQLTLGPAKAGSPVGPGTPAYAVERIDGAFQAAAGTEKMAAARAPMAVKGDLPAGLMCSGAPADCAATYTAMTEPSLVVATSFGNTTTLLRRDAIAVANIIDGVFAQ
jgi:hypothetical protein